MATESLIAEVINETTPPITVIYDKAFLPIASRGQMEECFVKLYTKRTCHAHDIYTV